MKNVNQMTNVEVDAALKIQGTDHDRKRKVTAELAKRIKQYLSAGIRVKEIAEKFGLSEKAVRYNGIDGYKEDQKKYYQKGTHAHGKHDLDDRANYKRKLHNKGLI